MGSFKSTITEAELKNLLKPRLRLFLSVDVVGSTDFKHNSEHSKSQGWLDFFTAFYTEFPGRFSASLQKTSAETGRDTPPLARLWKSLGDELVFTTEITHRSQCGHHIRAFRDTVVAVTKDYTTGDHPLPISFKATAWLAGFPVGNASIPIETDNADSSEQYDFIGPMIDIGFRLSRLSSPRRFTVSVDLAFLLLATDNDAFSFFYEGTELLKGVLSGKGYPAIWIDCSSEEDGKFYAAEDDLLHRTAVDPKKLKKFCEEFLWRTGAPLILPFIAEDDSFMDRPKDYDADLATTEDHLRRVFTVVSSSEPARVTSSGTKPIEDLEAWNPVIRRSHKRTSRRKKK